MNPIIAALIIAVVVFRAVSHKSLTPTGIVVAIVTAVIHASHPEPLPLTLLVVFFIAGSSVTKVNLRKKVELTHSSTGAGGGEGPRTHVQVIANSGVASLLILCYHALNQGGGSRRHFSWEQPDLILVGIICNYAAVAADTFSSELGILSQSHPRLITSLFLRKVAPGTNGGVSLLGTAAGFLGAAIIAVTSDLLLYKGHSMPGGDLTLTTIPGWTLQEHAYFVLAVTLWGGLGSLVDSFLGATVQASVIDTRTGKVIEGPGGRKVPVQGLVHVKKEQSGAPSRKISTGLDFLDNNGVNLSMAAIMSFGGIAVAHAYLYA